MSAKDGKERGKALPRWVSFFMIICTFTGAVLSSILIYFVQGEFPYEVLAGGLAAALILTVIEVIKQKRKKDHVPEADERIIHNVFRFFSYASHISLAIIFIALGIFTLLGKESISIFYLWIFFFAYIWVVGIGALVVKRR